LRRIHPETGDFGQPLDCILMLPEKTCDLLVELETGFALSTILA